MGCRAGNSLYVAPAPLSGGSSKMASKVRNRVRNVSSTMTISLPEDLKQFAIRRSRTAHFGTPSDYIRGLIREDLRRLEAERLEQELLKGLASGKNIRMTPEAWQRLKAEALRDRTH